MNEPYAPRSDAPNRLNDSGTWFFVPKANMKLPRFIEGRAKYGWRIGHNREYIAIREHFYECDCGRFFTYYPIESILDPNDELMKHDRAVPIWG